MVVTFCGHADFSKTQKWEEIVMEILERWVGIKSADIYLGGYGKFDEFAYHCCKKYKNKNSSVSLIFITPYLTVDYQRNHLELIKKK